MKNGFKELSVAILLPTLHFGLSALTSNVYAHENVLNPTESTYAESPSYEESSAQSEQSEPPAPLMTAEPTLPIPSHPDRLSEPPSSSLPKESQPKRSERPTKPVSARRTSAMPIPGRPSRNLNPPGPAEDGSEGSDVDESASAQESVGLLGFIPHDFHNGGLTIECIYTGESFTKARGGIIPGRPTNYRSNLDLVATIDTEKMGWWESGRFFVYGQNLSGKPLSATAVGDVQLFSNLDSTISETERPSFTTVAEYWYEHFCLDNSLRLKIGKQDANADFAFCDLGGDFVNSSFGLPPMIPLPTFPSQALGVASFYQLTETVNLGFGIYDGTLPSGPQGVRWGFDTLGSNGAISLYQLEFKPQLGRNGELPTTIRTGYWYHSSNDSWVEFDDVADPRTFRSNYGCYTSLDQMIWKEEFGGDNDQGLGVFFQFGWAPSNRNVLAEYYGGGLVYKGLLPQRDSDLTGLAFANVLFSGHYRAAEQIAGTDVGPSETAVELFYKALIGNNLSIQPDIQFIANPSGQFQDALLPGLRFEAVF